MQEMQAEVITQPLVILQGQIGQQEISSVYISVYFPKHFCLGYLALRQYEGFWSGLGHRFSFFLPGRHCPQASREVCKGVGCSCIFLQQHTKAVTHPVVGVERKKGF